MAKHPKDYFNVSIVRIFDFDDVPLQEVSLMDEQWLKEFAPALEGNTSELYTIGYHTKAIVNAIGADALELSIYLTHKRFHEIKVFLPRNEFVICASRPEYSVKPHIFVKGPWLNDLCLRDYSVFAIFDAIGVKDAIKQGKLNRDSISALHRKFNALADESSSVALVSFADSLLVKANYQLGQYDSKITYSYDPEEMIRLFPAIQSIYQDVLGLGVYAIITQGGNQYSGVPLLSLSRDHNHVSLNSLGLPFSQLLEIERAVRDAIRNRTHGPSDLYMDKSYFHSLAFDMRKFDKNARRRYPYTSSMDSSNNFYFAESFATISGGLRSDS